MVHPAGDLLILLSCLSASGHCLSLCKIPSPIRGFQIAQGWQGLWQVWLWFPVFEFFQVSGQHWESFAAALHFCKHKDAIAGMSMRCHNKDTLDAEDTAVPK